MAEMPVLGATHWIYLTVVAAIIVLMLMKRDIVIPSIIGIALVGFAHSGGNVIFASQTMFVAMLDAGQQLFNLILLIGLMVAMLKAMSSIGADRLIMLPAASLIKSPGVAFWVVAVVMFIASSFFWPTPATALVGTILIPIAVRAGLKPLAACMALNIAGHGMGLGADIIIQGAPTLTSTAAGVPLNGVLFYGAFFAVVIGVVALVFAFFMNRKEFGAVTPEDLANLSVSAAKKEETGEALPASAKFLAVFMPLLFAAVVLRMILGARGVFGLSSIGGGAATSLLGGAATAVLIVACFAHHRGAFLEKVINYLREGLFFSIKVFAPIIPIAGFFFLGSPASAARILGAGSPGLLFDFGIALGNVLPIGVVPLAIGMTAIGVITGLDGAGFSALPLIGSMAGALATPIGPEAVTILAGLGQAAGVFSGGGTLIAWAFGVAAAAGVAGVDPVVLVRKNFIPVMAGLLAATVIAIVLLL